jgi:hypothetical protein
MCTKVIWKKVYGGGVCAQKLFGNLKGKRHSKEQGVNGKVILNLILNK